MIKRWHAWRGLALTAGTVTVLVAAASNSTLAHTMGEKPAYQVKAIDSDCLAIQNAITALKPIHFISTSSSWKLASDQDVTVADRTKASVTIADVWKQGNNYAWVHSHTFDQNGNERATQLCFRQQDGSLERARQATTIDALNAAAAVAAYYTPKGTLIEKDEAFDVNDPAIYKKITDLPFYKDLP